MDWKEKLLTLIRIGLVLALIGGLLTGMLVLALVAIGAY